MRLGIRVALSMAFLAGVVACAPATPDDAALGQPFETALKGTFDALSSRTMEAAEPSSTPTAAPTMFPTITPASTLSPTPAPQALSVSVSLATNCRTGPGVAYPRVGSLEPGQLAQVVARSTEDDYWYIVDPEQSDVKCWIWGAHATVVGDVGLLPVFTPEPRPAAMLDFTLYRLNFSECGSPRVSLVVVNTGSITFKSARLHIQDLTATNNVYGPVTDSHPFADNPSSCPKDKGSASLSPGATAYLVVPMQDFNSGNQAAAYVTLCTEDDGQGDCMTRGVFFRLPDD